MEGGSVRMVNARRALLTSCLILTPSVRSPAPNPLCRPSAATARSFDGWSRVRRQLVPERRSQIRRPRGDRSPQAAPLRRAHLARPGRCRRTVRIARSATASTAQIRRRRGPPPSTPRSAPPRCAANGSCAASPGSPCRVRRPRWLQRSVEAKVGIELVNRSTGRQITPCSSAVRWGNKLMIQCQEGIGPFEGQVSARPRRTGRTEHQPMHHHEEPQFH
ncbi:hypothetical protein U9M48_009682 [Paspalum notatum var. saurae]|uniref:Uncharacterized protein n=1 Tax=Paspalum notatum var. saurae TaxID=547442 RepID=A0AAQ3SRN0_PASNO